VVRSGASSPSDANPGEKPVAFGLVDVDGWFCFIRMLTPFLLGEWTESHRAGTGIVASKEMVRGRGRPAQDRAQKTEASYPRKSQRPFDAEDVLCRLLRRSDKIHMGGENPAEWNRLAAPLDGCHEQAMFDENPRHEQEQVVHLPGSGRSVEPSHGTWLPMHGID